MANNKKKFFQRSEYTISKSCLQKKLCLKSIPTFSHEDISLTRRETQCLLCIILGMTAQEIGSTVYLSHRTVEDHIVALKDKFNCSSRHEIVIKALKYGFPIADFLGELFHPR